MEEEKKKVNTGIGYKNGKYRPSVFFDKSLQTDIEKHFRSKGYDSFNKYVIDLVLADMNKLHNWLCTSSEQGKIVWYSKYIVKDYTI